MRLAVFDDFRLGVVDDGGVRDVSAVVDERWHGTPYAVGELIAAWDPDRVLPAAARSVPVPLARARLRAPVPRPFQLLAAPLNYGSHIAEMAASPHVPAGLPVEQTARELGFFVKASGSVCGPSDAIELPPWEGRTYHHEAELAVVVGATARAVAPERALAHVFGYCCLIDVTMRMAGGFQEERPMRKSFETFTPMGPWITTADEVPDPGALALRLWVNDELRQDSTTASMICPVEELVHRASQVVTLHPGDVYATGTPEGVGPIQPGDRVRIWIERVGEFTIPVRRWDW